MAGCCIYGAFLLSLFLRRYDLVDSYRLTDHNREEEGSFAQHEVAGFDRLGRFRVSGMSCSSCVSRIETGLARLKGVRRVNVDLLLASAEVVYNSLQVGPRLIEQEIDALGFSASEGGGETAAVLDGARKRLSQWNYGEAFSWSLLFILPMLAMQAAPSWLLAARTKQINTLVLAGLVQLGFGLPFYRHTFLAVRHHGLRRLPMDALVSLGTLASYLASVYSFSRGQSDDYATVAASLICVTSLGKHLETWSRTPMTDILRAFVETVPTQARLSPSAHLIPSRMLRSGDIVRVDPGETFPCDGRLLSSEEENFHAPGFGNELQVDESFQTGESRTVIKQVGDPVLAGTVNSSPRTVLIHVGENATRRLREIREALLQAHSYKSQLQTKVEHLASFMVPLTLLLSLGSFLWWVREDADIALRSMVATLVVACPCALGLSTPAAIMMGISISGRHHVLVKKGARAVEGVCKTTAVVFDKTGTITTGELKLKSFQRRGNVDELTWWWCIRLASYGSSHPTGVAIEKYCSKLSMTSVSEVVHRAGTVTERQETAGRGISCLVGAIKVVLGNASHIRSNGVPHSRQLADDISSLAPRDSCILVAINDVYAGFVSFDDAIPDDTARTIAHLKGLQYKVYMMTGDRRSVAAEVAKEVGIDAYWAELIPRDKAELVDKLKQSGEVVTMVGDGLNDSLAFASANVAIALHRGSPLALASADVVLLKSSISLLLPTLKVAKAIAWVVKTNIAWTCLYNIILLPLAMGCGRPWGYHLSPTLGGLLMMGSSLGVSYNSVQLAKRLESVFRPDGAM